MYKEKITLKINNAKQNQIMKFQLDATVGKGSWPQPGGAFVLRDMGEC